MNIHHKHFITHLKKTGKATRNDDAARYLGAARTFYAITVPALREEAKAWAKANKDISVKELEEFLSSLVEGESHQEKYLAGIILDYIKKQKENISLKKLGNWFLSLEGWAEVDAMAYGRFGAKEVLHRWAEWQKFLETLSKSKFIQQRRAAIVFLTKPVSQSADERLLELSFQIVARLQHEKDIQITKAISWLLRSLSKHHAKTVKQYIKDNKAALPAIAVRETTRKIETGRK